MADLLKNGYQYIPAVIGPGNAQSMIFGADGSLTFYTLPFSTQVAALSISATGDIAQGTSGTPLTRTTSGNFMSLYTSTTATSGDTRAYYMKQLFKGAGGSGETLRVYSSVVGVQVAVGGTVNGAHITLDFTGAGASVSGAANALRCTLGASGTPTTIGGTVAVLLLDSDIAAGPTFGATTAYIAFDNVNTQKIDYLFDIRNASTGAGKLFPTASSTTINGKLQIRVNGTTYWIALTSSV